MVRLLWQLTGNETLDTTEEELGQEVLCELLGGLTGIGQLCNTIVCLSCMSVACQLHVSRMLIAYQLHVSCMSVTGQLPVSYWSVTGQLPVSYRSVTGQLPVSCMSVAC